MRVAIRIEETTLMFFDPDTRELLRTRPNPLTWDQPCYHHLAAQGQAPPTASNSGAITHPDPVNLGGRDRVHDRGCCPLYVRAQPETAGLPWTQRDHTGQKATAREPDKSQATNRSRWWWQVLGSNQRRLSRRFYRPLLTVHRNGS